MFLPVRLAISEPERPLRLIPITALRSPVVNTLPLPRGCLAPSGGLVFVFGIVLLVVVASTLAVGAFAFVSIGVVVLDSIAAPAGSWLARLTAPVVTGKRGV